MAAMLYPTHTRIAPTSPGFAKPAVVEGSMA
jgi:hypothetical protein